MAYNFMILADDYQALENKISEIKEKYNMDYDTISYNLEEEGIYALIDELSTISLFNEPKFVVARGAEVLLKQSGSAFVELLKVMNDPSSMNCLILVFTDSIEASNEQFIKLKRFASFFEIRMKNIKLDEYAKKTLLEDGYQIDDEAVSLLVGYIDNLSSMRNAIDLLECFCLNQKVITSKDIVMMIKEPLDDNVYSLIEAVLTNNKRLMLKDYQDLKLRSVLPSGLISMLLGKFQELYNVSILIKSGMTQNALAELFHVSSGRAYYMMKNAKETNLKTICHHLDLLNDLDYKIKTGKVDATLGLELYFLN
ncbi:MAG: DNA polymerase III subunit delta [Anaeroplasmataceae bacterium]|nr:DNA polymerase III subunit delta [Anaeroplasmataceae bacterium]